MLVSFLKGAPALLIKKERALVVGDLHIGLNLKFRESGIHFQKATERLAENLLVLYDRSGASNIVLLGDVKESITSPSFAGYRELKAFFDKMAGINVRIVKGNHDGDLEAVLQNAGFEIPVEREILMDNVALIHGNAWPSDAAMGKRYLIAGHGHYAIRKQDGIAKAWLVSRITRNAARKYVHYNRRAVLIVVPSFNELVMGSAISMKTKAYLPVFKSNVFGFETAKVYNLERKQEGSVEDVIKRG